MVNKTPLSRAAFTLVELVITIAIVIILSVISVPIYRGYVDKAKWSEGYALLGTILSAQKAYYSEYGNFFRTSITNSRTDYEQTLQIDARGNKYFTNFYVNAKGIVGQESFIFAAGVYIPEELQIDKYARIRLNYNITSGVTLFQTDKDDKK